ncbi:hypothetical protein [Aquiflexum sp.]|uniref:hypothetical protein n=1 Tax=Aquiflexum sp. TaxID=1872584 RepID=UPI00359448E5
MSTLKNLKKHLKRGNVYRRADLEQWTTAVDRHLGQLVEDGTLQKLSHGLYYYPKETVFGPTPPDEAILVRSFLKDEDFLITSPNAYNSLGVGTTQLYNKRVVYNHKRHGEFELGGRRFFFHAKPKFPKKLSEEFLLVDLINNLDTLAEDKNEVMHQALDKAKLMEPKKIKRTISEYGNVRTKKLLSSIFENEHTVKIFTSKKGLC